jgi:Flp pilus assembly protein TadD
VRIQSGRAAERVAMLRQARARHPKDYLVSWILGEALAQQSNAGDEAIRCLSDASRLAPGEAAPRVLLGKLLARRGDLAGAARELEAAVKIDGEDTQALYQLATVYRKAGNTKRADELFDRVAAKQGGPQAEPGLPKLEQVIRKSSR